MSTITLAAFSTIDLSPPQKETNQPAPQIVKESKIKPSRYLAGGQPGKSDKDTSPETENTLKEESEHRIKKIKATLSETVANTLCHIVEDTLAEQKTSEHDRVEKKPVYKPQPKKQLPEDNQSSEEEVIFKKPESKKVIDRFDPDESDDEFGKYSKPEESRPHKIAQQTEAEVSNEQEERLKMKTIANAEGDLFSGLIKKASTSGQTRELTLSSDDLSNINKKVYSCISDLQQELLR